MKLYPMTDDRTDGIPVYGVYIHGTLVPEFGCDTVFIGHGDRLELGLYKCTVEGHDGECIAFLWPHPEQPMQVTDKYYSGLRGLVVASDDDGGLADALRKYMDRSSIL